LPELAPKLTTQGTCQRAHGFFDFGLISRFGNEPDFVARDTIMEVAKAMPFGSAHRLSQSFECHLRIKTFKGRVELKLDL
jgi:hypothetical protein